MEAIRPEDKIHCRTIWISDVHLGSVHSKTQQLLQLLERVQCERLYLVGDIVDLLAMRRRVHWPDSHNKVLRRLMKLSRRKVDVIYVPGNHDHAFRTLVNNELGRIKIRRNCIHETVDGQRLLVTHGDELDYAVRYSRLNRFIGDIAYDLLMSLTRWVNHIRDWTGQPYWSLAKWVKKNAPQAERAIGAYQMAAINLARDKGYDGIICGHLHYPAIFRHQGIVYCNDGDWVENCSALLEDYDGGLRLIRGVSHPDSAKKMIFVDATEEFGLRVKPD
jgi:UDP-2,3-diacylglucosamine pyrophosphatase LpxH